MNRPLAAVLSRRPSRALTWLALLAFLFQGLIGQTHIHVANLTVAAAAQHSSNSQPDHNKAPDDCPACQLQAATGTALATENFAALFLPSFVGVTTFVFVALAGNGNRHQAWQSRAPPRA
jgi:hypothetical protein